MIKIFVQGSRGSPEPVDPHDGLVEELVVTLVGEPGVVPGGWLVLLYGEVGVPGQAIALP